MPLERAPSEAAVDAEVEAEVVGARPAEPTPEPLPSPRARRPASRLGNRATEALIARLRAQAGETTPRTTTPPTPNPLAPNPQAPAPQAGAQTTEAAPALTETTAEDRTQEAPIGAETAAPDAVAEALVEDTAEAEAPAGSEAVESAEAPAAADSAASGGDAELGAWRRRVAAATGAIGTPRLARSADGGGAVRVRGEALRRSRASRRETIAEEADAATSDAPEGQIPREEPPPDPVPEAADLVEAEAEHVLTPSRLDDLESSPRGTQPIVRDPAARRPEPEDGVEARREARPDAAEAGTGEPEAEAAAAIEGAEAAAAAPVPDMPADPARGAVITDSPPEPQPPLPPMIGNVMRESIARLLADVGSEAGRVIRDARTAAYPNGVLARAYEAIGNDRQSEVTEALTTALRQVAAEAGIAADDLDAAIRHRQEEVAEQAMSAAGEIGAAGREQVAVTEEAGNEEVGEVDAAEDAENAQAVAVVEAVSGEGSPEAIDARADRQIAGLNRRVADLRFGYGRLKDRRHAALERAGRLQIRAYTETADADRLAIDNLVEGPPTPMELVQKGAIGLWLETRRRAVGDQVSALKTAATGEATRFQESVTTAGKAANEQVRAWAALEKGEERNWWDELKAVFADWSDQAEVEAAHWATLRAGEARDATVVNISVLSSFVASQGDVVDLEANQAFQQLSEEQKSVVRAYYESPADNRDTLGAVAAGLRHRIGEHQKMQLIEWMKSKVMDKPASDVDQLNMIGAAEKSTFDAEKISSELYDAMKGGVTGWGTDEDKIYRNITGLTPVQGKAVRAAYRRDWGADLDDHLEEELDGDNALIRARAALDGDPVMETVGALNEAMAGIGTDEETIHRMLRGKSTEQRARIAEEYRRRYGVDLQSALDDEMDDHDQERAEALLDGDTARADAIAIDQAMHGGILGWGTDEAAIEGVYADIRNDVAGMTGPDGAPLTQEQMEAEVARRNANVEASYDQRYGSPDDQESALRAAFRDELSGPDLDLANALADNDLVAADAARLERERRGFYADDDVINGVLENQYSRALEGLRRDPVWAARRRALQEEHGHDPYALAAAERALDREMEEAARRRGRENMAALEARYDTEYSRWGSGGLQVMIAFNMSGTDREKAQALRTQGGYISPAQRIDFATRGAGTNEDEFDRTMAGRTRAEIEEINRELARMGRPPVEQLAREELTGRAAFDMHMRLQGVPENAEQERDQARERVRYELDNSSSLLSGPQERVMRERLERMEERYRVMNDPDADPAERRFAQAYFRQSAVGIQAGVEGYRAQVDAITDAAATAAALTAAIVVTVATGGVAGAVLGALAAAVATITVKAAMKGAAYGTEDLAVDAVVGIVDAAAPTRPSAWATRCSGWRRPGPPGGWRGSAPPEWPQRFHAWRRAAGGRSGCSPMASPRRSRALPARCPRR